MGGWGLFLSSPAPALQPSRAETLRVLYESTMPQFSKAADYVTLKILIYSAVVVSCGSLLAH